MSGTVVAHPEVAEFGRGFGNYIQLVPPCDLPAFLDAQSADLQNLLKGLSERESLVHHAPYTWSIRQVVGHVTDCERIFGYRAMRIARGDATPLPVFDDQLYVRVANFDRRPLPALLDEFEALRRSHILMLRYLEPGTWLRCGVVNDAPMSVRAMAYSIAGHARHHLDILHKRLGK